MKKYLTLTLAGSLMTLALAASPAFAQSPGSNRGEDGSKFRRFPPVSSVQPVLVGRVTAISGNTITVFGNATGNSNTTFTVDASKATVLKASATTTASGISVGDHLVVSGNINGANVVATVIRDGVGMMKGKEGRDQNGDNKNEDNKNRQGKGLLPPAIIEGNGQPVIGGQVSAVSGGSLTVTTKTNISYIVDATKANIQKDGATTTVSSVVVGDSVVVQGTVNGTSVTASTVIDRGVVQTTSQDANPDSKGSMGIFKSIGNFFSRIFGF
jgi:hypothetical protein